MANFHANPFDEATLTKLEMFENYARSWIPVFCSPPYRDSRINIVDLFAGPGRDSNQNPGNPLLLLKQIREYSSLAQTHNVQIRLILNEKIKKKAKALQATMESENIKKMSANGV